MWAVYLCGPTDCFLHAMFREGGQAIMWAEENDVNPEGYLIKFFKNVEDIDRTDTGWEKED